MQWSENKEVIKIQARLAEAVDGESNLTHDVKIPFLPVPKETTNLFLEHILFERKIITNKLK